MAPAREVRFSFQDAEWDEVFRWLAQLTGKALRLEAKPTGKFSYFDTRGYSIPESIDVINTVLLDKGFAILLRDNFLIVADLKDGIPPHLVRRASVDELPDLGRTELVRVLVPLEGLVADKAKTEFEPLAGPHGRVLALPSTNQLLIVDTARNVQQIVDLLHVIEGGQGKSDLRAFKLRYVSAVEVERVVRDLLGLSARQTPTQRTDSTRRSDDPRDRMREFMMSRMMGFGDGGLPGGSGRPSSGDDSGERRSSSSTGRPADSSTPGAQGPHVAVDERSNTLFVSATPDKLALVSQVVTALDVRPDDEPVAADAQVPRIEVYPVAAGTAQGLATVLAPLLEHSPETRVSPHPDDRAIIVFATPHEHERVGHLLEQLQTEGIRVEVIALRVLEAQATATLIDSLFGKPAEDNRSRFSFFRPSSNEEDQYTGPVVEPDAQGNRLVVRGTSQQIDEVRQLLAKLGEVSLAELGGGADRSRFRFVPLGQNDPQQLTEEIRRIWSRLDTGIPMRIEVLGQEPTRESLPPPPVDKPPQPKGDAGTGPTSSRNHYGQVRWAAAEEAAPPEPLPNPPKPKAESDQAEPVPVTIVVGPENLAITSGDPRALELVENLVNMLTRRQSGSSMGFGVYYLKVADAQETAYLVDEALYGSRSTFDSQTPPARILPDPRTNALLIIGPRGEQEKIQGLLEVLDRVDPPSSDVDVQTHLIPVRNASATELAEVIRSVFAAQLYQPPQPGRSGQADQGFSGGRSSSGPFSGSQNSRTRNGSPRVLTVGVEQQSNTVVVSAPRGLYEEVRQMIESLDEAARDNRRTARVVTLRNAKADAVKKALSTLMADEAAAKKDAKSSETAPGQTQRSVDSGSSEGRSGERSFDRGRSDDRDGSRGGPPFFMPFRRP